MQKIVERSSLSNTINLACQTRRTRRPSRGSCLRWSRDATRQHEPSDRSPCWIRSSVGTMWSWESYSRRAASTTHLPGLRQHVSRYSWVVSSSAPRDGRLKRSSTGCKRSPSTPPRWLKSSQKLRRSCCHTN